MKTETERRWAIAERSYKTLAEWRQVVRSAVSLPRYPQCRGFRAGERVLAHVEGRSGSVVRGTIKVRDGGEVFLLECDDGPRINLAGSVFDVQPVGGSATGWDAILTF